MKDRLRGFVCVLAWTSFFLAIWLQLFEILPPSLFVAFLTAGFSVIGMMAMYLVANPEFDGKDDPGGNENHEQASQS